MARQSVIAAILVTVLGLMFSGNVDGQTQGGIYEQGFKPYGSFEGGNIDVVNLMNGTLNLRIPLASYPQRGGVLKMEVDISYTSRLFQGVTIASGGCTQACFTYSFPNDGVGEGPVDMSMGVHRATASPFYVWAISQDGSLHQVDGSNVSFDGTAFRVGPALPPAPSCPYTDFVTDKNAVTRKFGCDATGSPFSYFEDTNGNKITTLQTFPGGFTDTMNRNITYAFISSTTQTTDLAGCTGALPTASAYLWSIPGIGGGTQTYKLCEANVTTNVPCTGRCETAHGTYLATQTVVLPNGTTWIFQYDSADPNNSSSVGYGDLLKVTFPTGGSLSYTWGSTSSAIECGSSGPGSFLRGVTSRTLDANDGQGPHTWTYTGSGFNQAVGSFTTTVQNPLGNQTVHTFTLFPDPNMPYGLSCSAYETLTQQYQGTSTSGTLVQSVAKQYALAEILPSGTYNSYPGGLPIRITTTLSNGQQEKVEMDYNYPILDGSNPVSDGNVQAQRDYDYGSGSPGSLLRTTNYSYQSHGSNYLTANLLNLVCLATTYGPGSVPAQASCTPPAVQANQVAQAAYGYDENNGSPQGVFGNQTSVTQWTNSNASLKTQTVYNSQGMPIKTIDPGLNQTQITYDSSGAFPSQIQYPTTNGIAHIENFSYDLNSGLLNSYTDQNSKTTSYQYDTLRRITSFTAPTPDGAQTTYCYTDTGGSTCAQSGPPYRLVTTEPISSTLSKTTITVFDGLGRPHLQQVSQAQGSSNYDTVETDYDSLGRVSRVSLPYSGSLGQANPNGPGTNTSYDALSRPLTVQDGGAGVTSYSYTGNDVFLTNGPAPTGTKENAKRRQLEVDGLHRLTSVCEITNGPGSGSCGQSSPQTGYWTKYLYDANGNLTNVVQNAQSRSNTQTRNYQYDGLSRLTSETNPESGTTQYFWDAFPSGCGFTGSMPGSLAAKKNNAGVYTCYGYDALQRLVGFSNSNDSNCFNYQYDSATPPTGVSVQNTIGRLVEAYTNSACNGRSSIVTDEYFSYDSVGRTKDLYQMSPNSGGWYHANILYYFNDAFKQISGLPTLPTFTYGVDPEGRINTLSASTGQNPLTGTTYNSASLPTGVTFGSGDSDAYSYDPNTNRMAQYQFNVNSKSFVGKLTWNANGTLASQQTTDPFNSADTQNCMYSHDDLVRIASIDCGASTWQQNFSYDAFGNLTKTVPTGGTGDSFQPTYSFSTNQMTLLPGNFTPTYDLNGNVLNNSAHTYTWNALGWYTSVDGVGVTYDAMGRKVELGGASELLYLPDGAYILFKGQVARQGTLKLPGGGQAFYDANNGGLVQYSHADYLGSFRLASTPARGYLSSVAYAPFGEQYSAVNQGGADGFAGYGPFFAFDEYDFPARQYSNQGRWVSPDPSGLAAVNPALPQSWNRYAYVLNSPLNAIDPDGLDCVYLNDAGNGVEAVDRGSSRDVCTDSEHGGTYFEGHVNLSSVQTDPNSDWVSAEGVVEPTGSNQQFSCGGSSCSQDRLDAFANSVTGGPSSATVTDESGNLSPEAALTLKLAGEETSYYMGCVAIPGAGMLAGGAAVRLGQPVAGSKPFVTPGTSKGTSPASQALRRALPQKLPFQVPTPVGGPGTGTPLRMAWTNKLGAAAGRYVPFAGGAVTVYSAYKTYQCLGSKP